MDTINKVGLFQDRRQWSVPNLTLALLYNLSKPDTSSMQIQYFDGVGNVTNSPIHGVFPQAPLLKVFNLTN